MRLYNKTCLITGGAKGLGESQARLFAKEGARIVIADILEERGSMVAAEIRSTGFEAMFCKLDTTVELDWKNAINTIQRKFGNLDVLVNNAGLYHRGRVEETTIEQWDLIMSANATSVFLGTKIAVAKMRLSGGGAITNISSVAGLIGSRIQSVYNASKGAIRTFTKAAAVQYAKYGIRVNSVHPGLTNTDMLFEVFPNEIDRELRISETPISRFGNPKDVAYGVLFLSSDEASYITGSELVIDGGLTAK